MLTRCLSVSVASSLHSIPGATCSHSGSDHCRAGGSTGWLARLLGDAKRKARLQRCRRTQHIGGPGDEPIDHRAEALQLALAIRARGDMGFGRGNLARRQGLQGVGARQLGLSQRFRLSGSSLIPPKRQTRAFGLVRGGAAKETPQPAAASRFEDVRRFVRESCAPDGRTVPHGIVRRGASAKGIFGAGDENAGAAGLAPDALVARSRRTVVVVAREELALVDPQLTVEEMQLFHARMRMRGVTRAGREAHQHADPVPFRVGREQLAFDPGRDLFPFRLGPLPRRRQHRLASPSPRRCEAQGAPAAMSSDAAHRWARRRTDRPPGGGSPARAGNPGTRRCGLRPRQPRSPPAPERRRRTLPRSARSGLCGTYSWLPRFRGQRVPQLVQS